MVHIRKRKDMYFFKKNLNQETDSIWNTLKQIGRGVLVDTHGNKNKIDTSS